jgi:hypothetical protein
MRQQKIVNHSQFGICSMAGHKSSENSSDSTYET